MTLRKYNEEKKKMLYGKKELCPNFGAQGCEETTPCILQDRICPYCRQNLGDGCPCGLFYERFFLSADGTVAICENCERKIQIEVKKNVSDDFSKKDKENLKIKFSLIFDPNISSNNISLQCEVSKEFDTDYIVELFTEEIKKIINLIKETEGELS